MRSSEEQTGIIWDSEQALAVPAGMREAEALVQLLSSGGQYVRTGLLLLPPEWLGREGEVAVRLGVTHVNYQDWKVERLAPSQSFLLLSAERLVDELDKICAEATAQATILISLFDLPLTALHPAERTKFWQFWQGGFSKRPRAMILALPAAAVAALPAELSTWQEGGRLATWAL